MRSRFASRGLLVAAVGAAILMGPLQSLPVSAQSPVADWEKIAGGKMSFDSASIKQDTAVPAPETMHSNIPLGPFDAFKSTGGLLSATDYQLIDYMMFAYKIMGDADPILKQLPKWAQENRYDIQARVIGNPTKDQFRLMMQALLADRFKLAIHYKSKPGAVLAMVLNKPGKLGPQLRRHKDDVPCPSDPRSPPGPMIAGGFPLRCHLMTNLHPTVPGDLRLGARAMPAATMATFFTGLFDSNKPIIDKTNLGLVDFIIEFPDANSPSPQDYQAGFLEALKDQLGLKLESATGPIENIVIDHIEEPSPN